MVNNLELNKFQINKEKPQPADCGSVQNSIILLITQRLQRLRSDPEACL
jgi:hypothetical protein